MVNARLRVTLAVAFCALPAMVAAPYCAAQISGPHVTITPYAGGVNWDSKVNVNGSLVFGGRLGLMFGGYVGLEGAYDRTSSTTRSGPPFWFDATSAAAMQDCSTSRYMLGVIANLLPRAKVAPFVSGGWQRVNFNNKLDDTYDRSDIGFDVGAGLLIRAAPRVHVRLEGRDFGFRFHDSTNPYGTELTHNIQYTAGVQFALGGSVWQPKPTTVVVEAPPVQQAPPPPPPPAPTDSDMDGVMDSADRCPNTPTGCHVDANGCPTDEDGDGVCDGLDQCAGTPANARVDTQGCPIEVSEFEREILETGKIVLRDVHFDFDKSDIRPESYKTLDEVGRTLLQWPDLRIEIGGHCDSRGTAAYNHALSHRRATAVLTYLLDHFSDIKRDQWTAVGYGEEQPVASNDTDTGRALNRRVEFKVLNNEALEKVRESRHILYKGDNK